MRLRSDEARAFWVEAPGSGGIRTEMLPHKTPTGHSRIETWFTGISAGTERLVGLGLVPKDCWQSMRCPFMGGSFALPVKYGYCLVGRALNGPYQGSIVYAMHPHQSSAILPDDRIMPLPEGLPALRATLIPTLETALNAIWDSECGTMDKVGIVGGGVVGLLIAFLLRSVWEIDPRIIEIDQKRRKRIEMLDWGLTVIDPADRGNGAFSLCFHASGNEQGLQTAIDRVGFEGRVLELSWFGNRPVQLNLGGSFHFERKQIISSQVNTVARPRRNTLNHRQRLEIAVEHLKNVSLDALISRVISFHELPEFMDRLYVQNPDGLACAVCYPAAPHIG